MKKFFYIFVFVIFSVLVTKFFKYNGITVVIAPAIALAAASGAASLLGSGLNAYFTEKNNQRNIAATEKANNLSYQRAVEMWNKQNLFNSPVEQMQRLHAAGLNPNLIYGNGSAAPGDAGDFSNPAVVAPHTNAVQLGKLGVADAINMYQNYQINDLNMRNLEANANNTNARTASEQFHASLMNAMAVGKNYENLFNIDTYNTRKNLLNLGVKGSLLDNIIKGLNIDKLNFQNEVDSATKDSLISSIKTKALQDKMNLFTTKLQWNVMKSNIFNTNADTDLKKINTKLGLENYQWLSDSHKLGLNGNDDPTLRSIRETLSNGKWYHKIPAFILNAVYGGVRTLSPFKF